MANKYCNLDGTKKIKDEFGKITEGFNKVESDMVDIIVTPAEGVSEQEIIQARKGKPTLGTKIDDIDANINTVNNSLSSNISGVSSQLNDRIDGIIATPTTVSEQEIIDARQGKTSLSANLNNIRLDFVTVLITHRVYPTYNPVTKVFDFKAGAAGADTPVILYDNTYYVIPEGTTVLNTLATSAIKLVFNSVSKEFRFVAYNEPLGVNDKLLAAIRDQNHYDIPHISANFIVNYNYMESRFNMLLGGENYPIIDTVAETLTFPSNSYDTVFYVEGKAYPNSVPGPGLVIDLSNPVDYGGTAICLLWEVGTTNFETNHYSTGLIQKSTTHIIFATIRKNGPGNWAVTMPCPYIKDGKEYGTGRYSSDDTVIKNTLDATVKAVAHRGYSTIAPENTLPAYRLAQKKGFSYAECDVEWTSDNIPVLLHDGTIDRTSNGTGAVSSKTLSELKLLDFGSWKSSEYTGTEIPTFEEFIIECKKLNLHPYIEMKGTITSVQATILVNIVKKLGMVNNVTWISFSLASLQEILTLLPKARVGYVGTISEAFITTALSIKTDINDVFIDSSSGAVTQALTEQALMSDIPVEVWTVNNQADVSGLVDKGVSGITTDHLNIAEILTR